MGESADTFTHSNARGHRGHGVRGAGIRVGGMRMDQELVKKKKKCLWSLACMREHTHINTHFLMSLGGPLATSDSLGEVIKTGCYKWLG